MNRFIKTILYIIAGCVGLGCAALILALVLGKHWPGNKSGDDPMQEAKGTVRDIVKIAGKKISHWDDGDDDDWEDDDTDAGDDWEDDGDAEGILEIEAEAVQSLDIDLYHGSLEIRESGNSRIHVEKKGDYDDVTAKCYDGEISIQDGRQGKARRRDVEIYLYIPSGMRFTEANVEIDAGVVDIKSQFEADRMVLNADAGEIDGKKIKSKDFQATVGAGEIDIEEAELGKVQLDCGLGTISLEASISEDAEISCGMGTVDLELAENTDNYNYILSCGMGTIEIGNNSFSALSKKQRINNGAAATFTIDCGMGTIVVE